MNIRNIGFKNITKGKKSKQVAALYTSMTLGIIIGIGVSILNTRLLGPQQYGDLKFLQSLFIFVVTFLTLGVFVSGSRLLAQRKHRNIKHELIGTLLLFATIVSFALIIALFVFSFFEERIFNNELGGIIRIFSPLLFVFPFQLCLQNIMQGDNRIYVLSVFQIAPRTLYLGGAIAFNYFVPLSLTSALAIQLVMFSVVIIAMIVLFKPKFENLRKNISIVWQENKTYGFQVYIGFLTGVATNQLGGLSIGYFIDNTNVGFFSLALTITMPLAMIPNAVGTTFFKDFANRNSIPEKSTKVTVIFSIFALLVFLLVVKRVVLLLYTKEYIEVIPMVYILSFGCVFHGLGDYINRFLGAHGKGKEIRNNNFAICIVNILGYTILTYALGVIGATITKLIASLTYLCMMYYYYKRYQQKLLNCVTKNR